MTGNTENYDLIIQNNASKQTFLFSGLTDSSETHLYHKFEDLDLDVPDGEYTFCLLRNERDDVTYDFKVPILDTTVKTGDGDILLKYLQPSTGLLRIGEAKTSNIYNNDAKKNFYYYDD